MAEYYTDEYGVRRPVLSETAAGFMSSDYEKQLQNSLGKNTDFIVPAYAFTTSNKANTVNGGDAGTTGAGYKNPYLELANKEGLFGLTNNTWNNLGQAAGLAGTAYGLYDSLLGNKAKLFKEEIGMLKEQRADNQEMLANKRKFNETWANASNGLAAKAAVGTM